MPIVEIAGASALRAYVARFNKHGWIGQCLHHSAIPSAKQYQGISTIEAVRKHHVNFKGWRDIAYQLLVGPDGKIFGGRSLDMDAAAQAAARPAAIKKWGGTHKPNELFVAVCALINADKEEVPVPMADSLRLVDSTLRGHYDKGRWDYHEHREFENKSCPGIRLYNFKWKGESIMPDKPSDWAVEDWEYMRVIGVMDGTRPHDNVTREELAITLARVMRKLGNETGGGE